MKVNPFTIQGGYGRWEWEETAQSGSVREWIPSHGMPWLVRGAPAGRFFQYCHYCTGIFLRPVQLYLQNDTIVFLIVITSPAFSYYFLLIYILYPNWFLNLIWSSLGFLLCSSLGSSFCALLGPSLGFSSWYLSDHST